LEFPF